MTHNNSALLFLRLLGGLEHIRHAVRRHDAEVAMSAFTTELLQRRRPPPVPHEGQQQPSWQSRQFNNTPRALVLNNNNNNNHGTADDYDDEALLSHLEYHGAAIATILNAMARFRGFLHVVGGGGGGRSGAGGSSSSPAAPPECWLFFYNATAALIHLGYSSTTRSHSIYLHGGMNEIVRMMQTYRSVDYIQIIGIDALMILGKASSTIPLLDDGDHAGASAAGGGPPNHNHHGTNQHITPGGAVVPASPSASSSSRKERYLDLESSILLQILEAMEYHQEELLLSDDARVYIVACSTLGALLGPENTVMMDGGEMENYIYHRVLHSITYGLILHVDDPVAQRVGNALLGSLVGTDVAQEMIAEVEQNHCSSCGDDVGGGIVCAAAAA